MKKQLTKLTLTATIVLAITFTFNACEEKEAAKKPTEPVAATAETQEVAADTKPPETASETESELSGGLCRKKGSPITIEAIFLEILRDIVNTHGEEYCHRFRLANGVEIEIYRKISDDLKKGDKVSVTYQIETCLEETEDPLDYDSNRMISLKKIGEAATTITDTHDSKTYKTFVDTRDNKTYKTIKIGKQVWMAENLNYEAKDSKCYDNKPDNCTKYGRLYNWIEAKSACPKGLHLPSDADWNVLMKFIYPSCFDNEDCKVAGGYLKSVSDWNNYDFGSKSGNGTDHFGFSAQPGGNVDLNGSFDFVGSIGYWWSANVKDSSAYYRNMTYYGNDVGYGSTHFKNYFFSVRCVQD